MNRFLISIIVGLIVSLSVSAFIYLKRRKVLSDAFTREKLCFGWAVIVIRSIVYCLPSILITAVLFILWIADFLVYAIGIFFFWVFVCCAWAFSSCGKWGLLSVVVCGFLIVVTYLVAEHRLQ